MQSPAKRISFLSLAVALGMVLSYIEAVIPVFFGIPGMKPGFSNILVVFLLYSTGWKDALFVNFTRIVLTGILFGNPFSIVYSLAGALLSLAAMLLTKRCGMFSAYGVSMAGGAFHNIGQIIVALILVENYRIILYLPPLLLSGCVTGYIVAFIAVMLLKRKKDIN